MTVNGDAKKNQFTNGVRQNLWTANFSFANSYLSVLQVDKANLAECKSMYFRTNFACTRLVHMSSTHP